MISTPCVMQLENQHVCNAVILKHLIHLHVRHLNMQNVSMEKHNVLNVLVQTHCNVDCIDTKNAHLMVHHSRAQRAVITIQPCAKMTMNMPSVKMAKLFANYVRILNLSYVLIQ